MAILRAKRTVSRRSAPTLPPTSGVVETGRAHVLDVPFAMRGVATASGARWSAERSVFVWRGAELPPALVPFRAAAYSWEAHVERELRADDGATPRDFAEGAARRDADGHRAQGVITPRPHQEEAAAEIRRAHAARRPGLLLADDVGLGKTITAWHAILGLPSLTRVLVVCPLAVVAHWRRTIETMGDGGKSVVILNYDRLGKLFEVSAEARKKIRSKKGLARAGSAPDFDVIVWDESHRCKNPTSARSKLAAKLVANAGFCLWLSATAGQNPLELSYLAPLLASVTGSRAADLKDFEAWCQGQGLGLTRGTFGRWEWRGDREDCAKVRSLLFDAPRGAPAAGLRRRPEDIAGWPEINRILTPIELAGEARELYEQAWTEFRKEMDLAPRGRDPKSALAATLRLRQKSSLVRVPGSIELVEDLLANEHRVAISVAFVETLRAIAAALQQSGVACAEIHGALPAGAREEERLRFQRGDARVVLFTVEEGISLHQGELGEHDRAPRSAVIHDLRWSAIQMAQIEGRCHRDGRFAQVYWAYADDTIEDRIARVVAGRIQSMKEMVGDDVSTLREIERLLAGG